MAIFYLPYVDPEYEYLMERIHSPRVSIDNKTCQDCTLVKVNNSVKRHGILLEMVQVLTDIDLVISKSYISSDGGWFMDVFHVTDQLGNKITDESLIHYIQQAICASKSGGVTKEAESCAKGEVRPRHVSTEHPAIEMTLRDRPGLMSEIAAALHQLGCNVAAAVAWTHNTRVACIIYVDEGLKGGAITDPNRLAQVQYHMKSVVGAHHENWERSVRLTVPTAGRTHTERRLHQLMYADMDYEQCRGCDGCDGCDVCNRQWNGCGKTHVSIETCNEKGYSVVNVRCRDRPKLLFDTVCVLTDMEYVVFHAAVSSKGCIANQEYFIRQKDGCTLNTEAERHKLRKCLIAAVERRVSHGLRLDVRTQNRMKLLSDVTRVFRENGLSISRAEFGTEGDKAVGTFYVTDASGNDVNPNAVEMVRREIGGSVLAVSKSSPCIGRTRNGNGEERPRLSLGNLLRAQLERLSGNFGLIRS